MRLGGAPERRTTVAAEAERLRVDGCDPSSAVLEATARSMDLEVRRLDDELVVVEAGTRSLAFLGLRGPSVSRASGYVVLHRHRVATMLARAGVATVGRIFALRARAAIEEAVTTAGYPVIVRPASLRADAQGEPIARDGVELRSRLDEARRASSGTREQPFVRIEAVVPAAERYAVTVVGREVVATHPSPDRGESDVRRTAIAAVEAIPGLAYATVDVVVRPGSVPAVAEIGFGPVVAAGGTSAVEVAERVLEHEIAAAGSLDGADQRLDWPARALRWVVRTVRGDR